VEGWRESARLSLKTGLTYNLLSPLIADMIYSTKKEHLNEMIGQNHYDELLAKDKEFWTSLTREIFKGPTVTRKLVPSKEETERLKKKF